MDCITECGRLTLVGLAVPTKAAVSLPSSSGQGRENRREGLWAETRAGRHDLAITVMSKTHSAWGNLFNSMTIKSESGNKKRNPNLKETSAPPFFGGFTLIPVLYFLPAGGTGGQGMRATPPSSSWGGLLTLFARSSTSPSLGGQPPQISPTWELPMGCSSSCPVPLWIFSTGLSSSRTDCSSVGPYRVVMEGEAALGGKSFVTSFLLSLEQPHSVLILCPEWECWGHTIFMVVIFA